MDVRCDGCQTEYELDDDSVGDSGAAVQCTSCGHTFRVTRNPAPVPSPRLTPGAAVAAVDAGTEAAGPSPAEWLLQTLDGRCHRFREWTTLQKWIIERKVTRDDRLSRTGHAWRPLGEIVELSSFFDVVDEADRARAAEAAARALQAEADAARRTSQEMAVRPGSASHAAVAGPVVEGSGAAAARRFSASREILEEGALYARSGETSELATLAARSRGRKRGVVVLGLIGAAGIGGYVAFGRSDGREPASPARSASAPPIAPPVAAEMPAPVRPVVTPTVAALAPSPSPPAASAAASAPDAANENRAAATESPSYSRLVAEGDRLLENGKTARAHKLYEKALGLRPGGTEALAGLGYVMLDQRKRSMAIAMFKQALASSATHGAALFGLAEAYRDGGERELALESYRRYIAVEPAGRDAIAARRQIEDLETGVSTPVTPPSSPSGEPAAPSPPPGPRPQETRPGAPPAAGE